MTQISVTTPEPPARPVPARKIGLVALDLDGTLIRSDGRLSHRTVNTIHEVQSRGIKVVIATARPPRGVAEIAEILRVETLQITYNGALIFDPVARRNLHHKPLPSALVKKMINVARKADRQVVVSLEILDKWYTDHVDETLPTETSRRFNPDFIGPLEAFLHVPITKLLLLAPPERIRPIREAVEGKFGDKVTAAISDKHLLQYIHREADKGTALSQIAQHYGVASANVMAIGDAPNDVSMLRWAGLGVAMENGWDITRQFADVVVPSNDDDGVAYALRKYVLDA